MDIHSLLNELLPSSLIFSRYKDASEWYSNSLTQGNALPCKKSVPLDISDSICIKTDIHETVLEKKKPKDNTVSFIDYIASHIDDMFSIYSYEIRRDARMYAKEKLVDWASLYARKFFGPSTSRSISSCMRARGIEMGDLERFSEFVSFLMDIPVKVGNKVVVWHGFSGTSRNPVCELFIKKQGVFVKGL